MKNTERHLQTISNNHLGHFLFFPQILGFPCYQIKEVTIINCGLKTSMFNIAYGIPNTSLTSTHINDIKKAFRGMPFGWWIPPHQQSTLLTQKLMDHGLVRDAREQALLCDLPLVMPLIEKTNLCVKQVTTKILLKDFIGILAPYDPSAPLFYQKLTNELMQSKEKLMVGYIKGKPVTIGSLFVNGKSAGIFNLFTGINERKKGYGTDMMIFLMNLAKELACQSITLSATSDSGYRIYKRLGFTKIGEFECFEDKGNESTLTPLDKQAHS